MRKLTDFLLKLIVSATLVLFVMFMLYVGTLPVYQSESVEVEDIRNEQIHVW